MKAVFADAFYFLALVNPKDRAHARAMDRAPFLALLENLATDPNAMVVPASQEAFDKARALFTARPDKEWSLTDCTSFVTMQEAGLTQAITGDRHFEQAGYVALLK